MTAEPSLTSSTTAGCLSLYKKIIADNNDVMQENFQSSVVKILRMIYKIIEGTQGNKNNKLNMRTPTTPVQGKQSELFLALR